MKAADVRKVLPVLKGITADAFDHVAGRLAEGAADLGDEYADLADFAARWGKLAKKTRKRFIEELVKSHALIIAGTVATRAGLKFAGDHQKQLSRLLLFLAGMIQPDPKTQKKIKKKAKKVAKNAKKKVAEVV